MKVAINAPPMPRSVVRIKPAGLFGPGANKRAMMPATKPMMITQRMCMAKLPTNKSGGQRHNLRAVPNGAMRWMAWRKGSYLQLWDYICDLRDRKVRERSSDPAQILLATPNP